MTSSGPWISFLLLLAVRGSLQKSTPASTSYKAAVVEFEPIIYSNNPQRTIEENSRNFVNLIEEASNENVDIIVFPELGLTSLELKNRTELRNWATFVPHPYGNYSLCDDPNSNVGAFLRDISCAADRKRIYVVVNIVEKKVCSLPDAIECPNDGFLFYSSNVVFDRKGRIIARYRKRNGFDEFGAFDMPKSMDISKFETDFGVTFGNAIGFDVFNEEPGLTLTRKFGVTDIVCPTAWYSVMPFMTAIQTQADWAHANDVNLLAAGYNRFDRGNFGSGIYAGRQGILRCTSPLASRENRNEKLATEVKKKPKKPVSAVFTTESAKSINDNDTPHRIIHDELRRKRDMIFPYLRYVKFDGFETRLVVPLNDNDNDRRISMIQELSHNKIVCEFKVNLTAQLPNPKPIYRYVAFDGDSIFEEGRLSGVKICALVLCANESLGSCGQLQTAPEFFTSIEISAKFADADKTLMMPNTLDINLLPVTIDKWNFRQLNDEGRATITLLSSTENLVTFGVWGRHFADSGAANFDSTIFNPIINASLLVLLLQNIYSHFS